jgi:hypothetical protein
MEEGTKDRGRHILIVEIRTPFRNRSSGRRSPGALAFEVAHSGAETHGHFDLFGCKLGREVGTRHMCRMEARTFQSAAAQVEAAQIGLPKVAIGKIDIGDVHAAQIDASKVATAKVARLAGLTAPIEFLAAALAQEQVQGIG